ncbi:MAG: adenosine kinase [Blastochloris sp.]|nr:adenosine kinase [Blastochloris sp.]
MSINVSYLCIGVGAPIMDSIAQVPESFLQKVGGAKGGMEYLEAPQMEGILLELIGQLTEVPGGSSANTVQALAQLGLPVTFLGKIGNDSTAQTYMQHFKQAGGDTSKFKKGDLPHARCLSLVTPDSERTMRTHLGAAVTLSPTEITVDDFKGCRHAHLEGYLLFNPDLAQHIIKCAHEAGCTISLDLASFEVVHASKAILKDLLTNYVDIIFANEDEAKAFTGKESDYAAMALELSTLCDIAAVKVGKKGSFIAQNGKVISIAPQNVETPLDTTGAGDAWAAGFLYGWLTGLDLEKSGALGSRLGAEVVQVLGPKIPAERWSLLKT